MATDTSGGVAAPEARGGGTARRRAALAATWHEANQ